MQRSSLYELLKTFSDLEFREFLTFVSSPYFNKEKVLEKFAGILFDSHPDFGKSNEEYFSNLYPGKEYNDSLMRNIRSDLLRLAEKFLAVKGFLSSQTDSKLTLVRQLSKRNLTKQSLKQISGLTEILDSGEVKDGEYFLYRFLAERESDLLLTKSGDKYLREAKHGIIRENLVIFFLINFIHYATADLNRGKMISDTNSEDLLPSKIEEILEGDGRYLLEVPYINLFYQIYRLLKDEDEKHFYSVKKMISEGLIGISDSDKASVLSAASNFAYLKVLSGDQKFLKDQYELIVLSAKEGLHKKHKGHLPLVSYLNAVILGLELEMIEDAERFIKEYSGDLLEDHRKAAQNFCNALVLYKKKDYEKAIAELSEVTTEEFSLKQQIKSLYLKICYDINDTDMFYFHTDRYSHFISENKKIHKLVKKQLSDYLKYTKKLFALKNSAKKIDSAGLEQVIDSVKSTPSIINRKWLLEKADEIRISMQ